MFRMTVIRMSRQILVPSFTSLTSWDVTNVPDTANDAVNVILIDVVSKVEMTLKLIPTMRSV